MKLKPIRNLALVMLALVLVLTMMGCGKEEPATVEETRTEEGNRLTMFVGLGNTAYSYYPRLHDLILENTGIDVQYVQLNTMDTTLMMQDMIANYDLPADIVITAYPTDTEDQKNAFLDLASYTNLPDLFTSGRIQELSVDGAVYQLPFSTRLIGIEYNKTLMEEMGWEVPHSFDEMVALKEECEAAGYTFAISGGVATGHGMNYLFHLMGSQYLSTPDGTEWLRKFQAGEVTIDSFREQAEYFRSYVEAGLFGDYHSEDWLASQAYCRQRALFYYNIINDVSAYDGYRYNADGTIYGATYADDQPEVVEDAEGEAVFYEGAYVYYDETNEAHKDLQRYTIPGAQVLHDTYASMPWITQSGTANCFTRYDSMYVALDKKLTESDQAEKLEQAIQVLEFMLSDEAVGLFTDMYPDGYVATSDFAIDESRLYYDCASTVTSGYLMPWYYSDFDMESIANVGQKVNEYIGGVEGGSFEAVMDELEKSNDNYVNSESTVYTVVTEQLEMEDVARLEAIAGAVAVQDALDAAGLEETVDAALIPYLGAWTDISDTVSIGVVQRRMYAGDVDSSMLNSLVNSRNENVSVIRMTGMELKALVEKGYNSLEDLGYDHAFAYKLVLKGDGQLEEDREYLVAVAQNSLTEADYTAFAEAGKVLTLADGSALTGKVTTGLEMYFGDHSTIAPDALPWD